jgi:multiple sugar transport system permease protein
VRKSAFRNGLKSNVPYYVLMAPYFILFIVFILLPIIITIVFSFTDFDMLQMPSFVGLNNYFTLLFDDNVFMIDLRNTLEIAAIVGPVGYILSFMVAWFINELGRKTRTVLTLIMYAPALCATAYVVWQYIFASDSKGLINNALIQLGIMHQPILWLSDPKYDLIVVIVVTIWMSFSVGFLAFIAGLQSLDRTYYEAAAIDGLKNRWQELYYVTFPQMGSMMLFGAIMSISAAFAVGNVNMQMTGFPSTNYSTDTIWLHMIDYGTIRYEMGYACAVSVILFMMMLLTWFIVSKVLKKFTQS